MRVERGALAHEMCAHVLGEVWGAAGWEARDERAVQIENNHKLALPLRLLWGNEWC